MSDNSELVVSQDAAGKLTESQMAQKLSEEYLMPAQAIVNLIRTQIIAIPKGQPPATGAEFAVVMTLMLQLGANPILKELHAWRDRDGKLITMAGYDLWVKMARRQPTYRGVSYKFGPLVDSPDKKGGLCWEWVQPIVHDSVAGPMEMTPVFLEEWYVKQRYDSPGPWQKQPRHRLHLKAFTSAIREVYGLSGVVDEVDRDIMQEQYHRAEYATAEKVESMAAALPELDAAAKMAMELNTRPRSEIYAEAMSSAAERHDELVDRVQAELDDDEPAGVDESDVTPPVKPVIDTPCGFKGCSGMAVARCGECGEWVCSDHLGENGFSCKKHEEAANG